MFAKVMGDPAFASAVNVTKFDVIVVRRSEGSYKISAYNVPLKDMGSYTDIATFDGEHQAMMAFDNLMVAIADGQPYWSLD